ncbi:MAG: agmatinase [Candidatus Bathyarchaeota archaeon]
MDGLFKAVLKSYLNTTTPIEEAKYTIFGAPLDSTSTYRSGSRFAPGSIRRASLYMESYSPRTGLNHGDISLADAGDLIGLESVESLGRIEKAISLLTREGNIPVMIGGEHTITLGALRSLKPDLVICFDAHLDLRNTILGQEMSHGTFMRRALEELDFRLVTIGVRAISSEELDYAEKNQDRVSMIQTKMILRRINDDGYEFITDWIAGSSSAYISIDMDVVDPAIAPAVGNPSPEGISITTLLDLIDFCVRHDVVGFDLTEVTPHYDSGLTAIQAAYILLETLYSIEKHDRLQSNK